MTFLLFKTQSPNFLFPVSIVFSSRNQNSDLDYENFQTFGMDLNYKMNYCNFSLDISKWAPGKTANVCLVPSDRRIILHIKKFGNFESGLQDYLFNQIFPNYPKAVFVDIGANVGVYTVSAALLGRTVFAFEPMQDTFKALSHTISINGVNNSVYAFNYALENEIKCYRPEFLSGNPGATKIIDGECSGTSDNSTIKVGKLDQLLPLFTRLQIKQAIVKMDVEGSEANVISGGQNLLEQIEIPYIQMEMMHTRKFLSNFDDPEKTKLVQNMLKIMDKRFKATLVSNGRLLDIQDAYKWPFNVAWRNKESMNKP